MQCYKNYSRPETFTNYYLAIHEDVMMMMMMMTASHIFIVHSLETPRIDMTGSVCENHNALEK